MVGAWRGWRPHQWRIVATLAVAAAVTIVCLGARAAGVAADARFGAVDALFPVGGDADPSRVTVVGIDESTLATLGHPWPLPRDVLAEVVGAIVDAGADVVGVDLLLAGDQDGDQDLARQLSRTTAVLASFHDLREGPGGLLAAVPPGVEPGRVADAATSVAHAAVVRDPHDGVTRRVPLVHEAVDGGIVTALSAEVWRLSQGLPGTPILRSDGLQFGEVLVPTEDLATLRLAVPANLDALVVPAQAVVAGDVDLTGRTVLLGVTGQTLGADQHRAPSVAGVGIPGVVLHAIAVHTLDARAWLVPVSPTESALWLVAVVIAGAAAALWLPLWLAPIAVAGAAGAHLVGAFTRFDAGHVPDLVLPLAGLALGFVVALGVRYGAEERARRRVTDLFARYVPAVVVDRLVAAGRDRPPAGEHAQVSVLFCDLRGFTPLAHEQPPDRVRALLDTYYQHATEVIDRFEGTLLQFVGDEVYAVFGVPLAMPDHADRAVACAQALLERHDELNVDLAEQGLPPLEYGIGVHSGPVVAAHLGDVRRQYVLAGDAVNVGSRLCGQARGGEAVVSRATLDVAAVPIPGPVEQLEVAGLDASVAVQRLRPTAR